MKYVHFASIIFSVIFCLVACNDATLVTKTETGTVPAVIIKNDTIQVQTRISDFLRWYKNNISTARTFRILTRDSSGNYMVSNKACSDYFTFLGNSGYISKQYIGYWQTYFKHKETELREHPQKDYVPEGFDFDFILITQNPETILNQVDNLKYNIVSMSDSVALVGMKLPAENAVQYEFEMYKAKEGWKLGYISTPNYD